MVIRTTRELLRHAFEEHVFPVTAVHLQPPSRSELELIVRRKKEAFISVLLHRSHQLKTEPNIRKSHLIALANLAESTDWMDPHRLKDLYRQYHVLTGESFP